MNQKTIITSVLLLLGINTINAQSFFTSEDTNYTYIKPYAMLQLWGVYSMDEKFVNNNGSLEAVQDRANLFFRGARLGFKGNPYKGLSYNLMLAYDNLGQDRFTSIRANSNDIGFDVFEATLAYRVSQSTDLLNVTAGFFRPQISRESLTGPWAVNSFDKAPSQNYVRNHLVRRGTGRAMGVNIGGMQQQFATGFNYNVGMFNTNNTEGRLWSPLLVARAGITLGLEEMEDYSTNYNINYFNKRRGLTISGGIAHQGQTDSFEYNTTYSGDFLFNFDNLNIDGEINLLERNYQGGFYSYETGHIRMGYNIVIAKKYFIEPTVMYSYFNTIKNGPLSGYDKTYDIGINWYINKNNLKLNLHYVIQEGKGVNLYTDGISFQKGNYLGLGLQLLI